MTRKQALQKAYDILSKDKNNEEIAENIKEILDEYPLCIWTPEKILDAIEQFIIEKGYFPSRRDFVYPLPNIMTVHSKLKTESLEEVQYYYFNEVTPFAERNLKEYQKELVETFRRNYLRIGNGDYVPERIYNQNREPDSPNINTIRSNTKLKYNELLAIHGFRRYSENKLEIVVKSNKNAQESLKANKELKKWFEGKKEKNYV